MKTNSTGHSPVDPERNTTIPGEYLYTEIVSPSVIKVKVTGLKYNIVPLGLEGAKLPL